MTREKTKSPVQLTPDLAALTAAATEPTDAERRRVTDLALRAQQEVAEVVRATAALRNAVTQYRRTTEEDLPAALMEIGQSEFKLLDGTPVIRKEDLRSGWLRDDGETANPEGLAWVEAHGGRPLVKATIVAEFDAEDLDAAREIYNMIRRHPVANRLKSLEFTRRVLGNSLCKWVRQLRDQLRDPPLELLGVHRHTWVQVGKTQPKTVPITGFVER